MKFDEVDLWPQSEDVEQFVEEVNVSDNEIEIVQQEVPFEMSVEDEEEAETIRKMFGNNGAEDNEDDELEACCQKKCNSIIPKELAVKHRRSFLKLSKSEQEIVILSHLLQHRRTTGLQEVYAEQNLEQRNRTKSGDLERLNTDYFFAGIQICRKMYFFILGDFGKKQYENIVKHFDAKGLTPRNHGHTNKTPKRDNLLSVSDRENAVTFIKEYADQFGYPLPGRVPQFKNYCVIKLPPSTTKQEVYNKYIAAGMKKMESSTFRKIWLKYCPYVVITKPATDLGDQLREVTKGKRRM